MNTAARIDSERALLAPQALRLLLDLVPRGRLARCVHQIDGHVAAHADPRQSRADIDQDHVDLARAIASGRPAKARSRMEEHILLMVDIYKDQIGARLDDYIEWR